MIIVDSASTTKKSNDTIQIMRAVAILFVLIHHSLSNLPEFPFRTVLLKIVYSDVPIFFIISGFLFEKNIDKYAANKLRFIGYKAKQLILPYLFWTLILYIGAKAVYYCGGGVSANLARLGFEEKSWADIAWSTLTMERCYVTYLWYIYVLFVFFAISSLHMRKWKKRDLLFIPIVLLFGTVINSCFTLPMIVSNALKFFSDFLLGRFVFAYKEYGVDKNVRKITLLVCICVFTLSMLGFPEIMFEADEGILKETVSFFCGKGRFYSVAYLVFLFSNSMGKGNRAGRVLKAIGDDSYAIYLMHNPYVVPLICILMTKNGGNSIAALCLAVVMGTILPILISKVIRRIPVVRTVMLGR